MSNYIDGFVLPIPRSGLDQYKRAATEVAEIWKEHGAIAYFEYVGDDMKLEGTLSFIDLLNTKEDEVIIFGWAVFESRKARDLANEKVAADPRMTDLIAPLTDSSRIVLNPERMAFGGFLPLVQATK